jgi:hypothetical protein
MNSYVLEMLRDSPTAVRGMWIERKLVFGKDVPKSLDIVDGLESIVFNAWQSLVTSLAGCLMWKQKQSRFLIKGIFGPDMEVLFLISRLNIHWR